MLKSFPQCEHLVARLGQSPVMWRLRYLRSIFAPHLFSQWTLSIGQHPSWSSIYNERNNVKNIGGITNYTYKFMGAIQSNKATLRAGQTWQICEFYFLPSHDQSFLFLFTAAGSIKRRIPLAAHVCSHPLQKLNTYFFNVPLSLLEGLILPLLLIFYLWAVPWRVARLLGFYRVSR